MNESKMKQITNSSEIKRENNFAILHFAGALMVMYGHQYALLQLPAPALLGNGIHAIGVKMIFVITGYLVTNSFLRDRKLGNYLKRRLIRIYPAYIVCILLSAIVLGPLVTTLDLKTYFTNGNFWHYILNNIFLSPFYGLPGAFDGNPYVGAINGSIWTIPVEISMYLFIGLLCTAVYQLSEKLRVSLYLAIVLATCIGCLIHLYGYPEARLVFWGTDWLSALYDIPYFFIGSFFEVGGVKKHCNFQIATMLLFAACSFQFHYHEAIAMVALPYFTMSFALCEKPVFSGMFRKNNIAYGIYLYGFPAQQLLIYVLKVRMELDLGANYMYILSLVLTVILALLSHRFIELPIEGFLRSKLITDKKKLAERG